LKPADADDVYGLNASRPAWARGLKRRKNLVALPTYQVAPCVGAWIETQINGFCGGQVHVAPCVGAWIETSDPAT